MAINNTFNSNMQTTTPSLLLDKKKKPVTGLLTMSPVQSTEKMKVPSSQTPSSPGNYKGVAINPGNDAQVRDQIAMIDKQNTQPQNQMGQQSGPAIQQTAASVRGLFPSVPASIPKNPFNDVITDIVNRSQPQQQTQDISSALQNIGTDGVLPKQINDLSKLRQDYAKEIAGIESTPIPLEFQQGRGQVLGRQFAAQEGALQQGIANTLQGQTQQISALQSAGNLGTTAQQIGISGLGSAAGFSQPQVAGFGQTTFNPLTNSFGAQGGAGGDEMDQALQQYAQLYATGQQSAIPSFVTSNPILNAKLLNYAKQINPNFNVNSAAGIQAGQQGNAQQVVGMQAANTAAKGIESTIKSFLSQNPQINPSNLVAGNAVQQWLNGKQLADPRYQTLFNYINEYISTLAPVLGVGGDTTNLKTQIAQSFVNAQASGESISQVLDDISNLADNKVQNFSSGGFGGGVVNNNSNTGTGLFNW